MIELVKISENISRQFDGQETVDNLQGSITELWRMEWKKAMSLSGKAALT